MSAFDPLQTLAERPYPAAMRQLVMLLALVCLVPVVAEAKSKPWPCYWVHGRMTAGNGTPSTRIWPVGTHRMLGVVSPGRPDVEVGEMPNSVLRLLTAENDFTVWGDFHVCPVSPERAGWMRFVVVKEAKGLFPRRRG
jgi:hypothetical protein